MFIFYISYTDKLENNSNQQNQLKKKLDGLETDITHMRNKLTSFEYIWEIKNFKKLKANAKSGIKKEVYSNPFYSSEFGYKMRLKLYPDGAGSGRGTHVSIFRQVMKGRYDAILNWPIEYTGEVSILDQLNHKDHHSNKIESDSIKHRKEYAKPIDEFNDGLGSPTFISLDKLEPLYLVDDTIFIKFHLKITS
uniref:MATH domain-containing protein n=1 Tax=Strigamia maritima TaxID=126957 RepID=T1J765_STRMM